ncbi:pilus assembly PilX N-terminal domain-containing protein [Shewanella schlegeliana]|uniref:Pilus assembly PilX N-terminal domain-containing protein n=1 Tax=Shewanella schlegeliana TaxID=190308 RepID=A0ABS1SUR3_9GAMM|nr:pilus assembly PilX N-terminal domain-containing protein [Shewanella schlegeliana]MBL4912129.1 pilus assembly PilX N-terminal domain-containing protein [Shewanella schlegeliana]MCL1110785.1 pilus assembly PilX N-terminal domain-containing protein [Shewanella schlegeliana]
MSKQKGVVLFFSLIILLIMTVIGVALAVNSNQSIKMAGAGSERIEAMVEAHGALDKVLSNNAGATLANINQPMPIADDTFNVSSLLSPMADGDVACQRSAAASGANLVSCRRVEVATQAIYGRDDMGQVTIVTGIEQEVLTGS